MQAHDMPFTKLINVDQGAREHFHVPKYQREYSWRKWQWEELLNDIDDNGPGYFMGSIICVSDNAEIPPGDELIYEVVDGQQRLTTLSLLIAAIHTRLIEAQGAYQPEDSEDMDELRSSIANIRAKLIKRKKDGSPTERGAIQVGRHCYFLRVQPSAQSHNLADYRYILFMSGIVEEQPKQAYFGNRLLARAYSYFLDKLPAEIPELLKLMEKINQLMFVQITVGSQADAFTLFESLNNRGVPLSAMDIIKNKMLAQMERKHEVDIDESFERWQGLVEAIPDANDQERFLRQFYNCFKHQVEIRVDKVPRATRSVIIRIYETLINRDAELIFKRLTEGAAIYGKLLRADCGVNKTDEALAELARIGSAPGYLLLLYLFSLEARSFDTPAFLGQVVDLLARYFIRRNVTDKPPTREIDQSLINVVEACAERRRQGAVLDFAWFFDTLSKYARPASLLEFKSALCGPIYDSNAGMARYLLIQLDQMHHSREYKPDFWARDDKDRFVWTVEHVLPQAEKLPEHWVHMLAQGDRARAMDIQDALVHRLGNLTLSGYNSDLATASFEKKQKLSKDKSFLGHTINIGYKNGLALNTIPFTAKSGSFSLATALRWDAEMIEARTTKLVDLIVKANLLPGEDEMVARDA